MSSSSWSEYYSSSSSSLFTPGTGFPLISVLSVEVFVCALLFAAVFAFCLAPEGLPWALSKARFKDARTAAIPGPSRFPLLGLVFAFTGSLTHRVLAKLADSSKAVHLMAFSIGFIRFIISSQPETAKEILSSSAFADWPVKESAYELLFHRAMGFAPYGEYWRNLGGLQLPNCSVPRELLLSGGSGGR